MGLEKSDIEQWMRYRAPSGADTDKLDEMRLGAVQLAWAIEQHIPPSGCKIVALRKVKEALMSANAALCAPMPKG